MNRRDFLRQGAALAAGAGLAGTGPAAALPLDAASGAAPLFRISLAEWSFHRALQARQMDNLDFAATAARLGFEGIEYVNQFFKDKARDQPYLRQLRQRAADAGVQNVLIMVDGEGGLGDPDPARRAQAVENHHRWVEAARFLGCHSIRVNAYSEGTYEEQVRLAADGLRRLADFGDQHDINIIVENHGGLSSNGAWLAEVMRRADHRRVGTLPDFGNFRLSGGRDQPVQEYDRYKGVAEMMPWAKGVSAKSHEFDAQGNETRTDYRRMLRIVLDAGYRGFVGVEYEGPAVPEEAGVVATKRLLERVRDELAPQYG